MSYAWITYVDNDIYLTSALVLYNSLQSVNTRYPFVILISANYTPPAISNNIIIKYVHPFDKENPLYSSKRYKACLNKIHIWNEVEYAKVCWLDADVIVMKNIDHVFDIDIDKKQIITTPGCTCNVFNHPKLPTQPELCPFNSSNNIYISAGILLTKPNRNLYEELQNLEYNKPFCEQDVFNEFFKGNIILLPIVYNYFNHLHLIHPDIDFEDVFVFHFGYGKPWETDGEEIYKRYYKYWWNLEKNLNL